MKDITYSVRGLITSFLVLFFFASHAQIPQGYYLNAEGKSREELKAALYNIIKGHVEYPYTSSSVDTWDILKETDKDPNNPANVTGIYSAFSMDGEAEYNNGQGWNREHVWAKSRGDFGTSLGPGTDVHHLRAADISTNSARNNRSFAECTVPYVDQSGVYQGATGSFTSTEEFVWKPREEVKGDVARMIFYMAVRYEGENGEPDLELVDYIVDASDKSPVQGRLSDLLIWHTQDPVDDYERQRNDIIFSYQENRNPFIDHPEYVTEIWGNDTNPDPITFTSMPVTTATVNVEFVYDISASGGENNLSITATQIPAWLNFTDNQNGTAILRGTPAASNVGEYSIIIEATDGVTIETQSFTLSVSEDHGIVVDELFISEYIEGSTFNKAIEIANLTNEDVDLSIYSIKKQTNGTGAWSPGLTLSGTLANGDVFVVANSSSTPEILEQSDISTAETELSFNGNDPIGLFKNDVLIDIVGVFNDAGNFGQDVTKVRNGTGNLPETQYANEDWDDYSIDTFEYLGSFSLDAGSPNQKPEISIESPLNNSTFMEGAIIDIMVSANDVDGTIQKVVFYEGDNILGEVNSAPYTFSWSNASIGEYMLSAVAFDDQNDSTQSEGVNVKVEAGDYLMLSSIIFDSYQEEDGYIATADILISSNGSNLADTYLEVVWYNSDSSYVERQAIYTNGNGASFMSSKLDKNDFTIKIIAVNKEGYTWDKLNSELIASSTSLVTSNQLAFNTAIERLFYPNPFSSSVKFELIVKKPSSLALTIYDSKGVRVKTYSYLTKQGANEFEIGNSLTPGIYSVQLSAGDWMKVFKVIKE